MGLKIDSTKVYCCLEELLIKAVKKEEFSEELHAVMNVYGDDLHASNLKAQLEILSHDFPDSVLIFLCKGTPTATNICSEGPY